MQINELKGARSRCGYKQKDLAEKIGMSLSSYNNKENGKTEFTDDQKKKISQVLQLTPYQMNLILYDGLLPIGPDGLLPIEAEQ